jgi:hypothetical protein
MSKLKQWLDSLDEDEAFNKLLDRLVTLTVAIVVFWELMYIFVWSK